MTMRKTFLANCSPALGGPAAQEVIETTSIDHVASLMGYQSWREVLIMVLLHRQFLLSPHMIMVSCYLMVIPYVSAGKVR